MPDALGPGRRAPVAADRQRRPLGEVPDVALELIANDGSELPAPGRIVNIEDYERTLYPGLVDQYEEQGYCWVVVGSTQRGRAEVEPEAVPRALAYYRELERRADTAYVASPYRDGARAGRLQLRLVLRLLPAGLPPAGADDADLPPARRAVRRGLRRRQGRGGCPRPILQNRCSGPRPITASLARDRPRDARVVGACTPTRSSAPSSSRTTRSLGEGWHAEYGGPHAEVNAIARLRRRRPHRRDDLRLAGAVLPPGQDAAVHRRDPRSGDHARRRRLRRPHREGLRPRPRASCATRASRSTSPAASWPRAPGSPTRRSASTRAPGGRGCCSSPR